jgi:hypothetical protein
MRISKDKGISETKSRVAFQDEATWLKFEFDKNGIAVSHTHWWQKTISKKQAIKLAEKILKFYDPNTMRIIAAAKKIVEKISKRTKAKIEAGKAYIKQNSAMISRFDKKCISKKRVKNKIKAEGRIYHNPCGGETWVAQKPIRGTAVFEGGKFKIRELRGE